MASGSIQANALSSLGEVGTGFIYSVLAQRTANGSETPSGALVRRYNEQTLGSWLGNEAPLTVEKSGQTTIPAANSAFTEFKSMLSTNGASFSLPSVYPGNVLTNGLAGPWAQQGTFSTDIRQVVLWEKNS